MAPVVPDPRIQAAEHAVARYARRHRYVSERTLAGAYRRQAALSTRGRRPYLLDLLRPCVPASRWEGLRRVYCDFLHRGAVRFGSWPWRERRRAPPPPPPAPPSKGVKRRRGGGGTGGPGGTHVDRTEQRVLREMARRKKRKLTSRKKK